MLKGARVALAPLTAEHPGDLFEWINDRDLVLFNAAYKPVHAARHREWFEAIQRREDAVIFGIRKLDDSGGLIGTCQLHGIHPVHRSAELQIRIGVVEEQGRGQGSEATRLLLDFAFRDLNLRRVFLHVFSSNARAVKVYERAGFRLEGRLREAVHVDGEYLDVLVMGILRAEYEESRRHPPA